MAFFNKQMSGGALISSCGNYRYSLWRVWDMAKPPLLVILLNPSKANATEDDNTIRWLTRWAAANDFGGVMVVNLFAYRATVPSDMKRSRDPIGPENDKHIRAQVRAAVKASGRICVAWGTHGDFMERDKAVVALVRSECRDMRRGIVECLGVTKGGFPVHPVRLGYDRGLKPYEGRT